MAKVLTYMQHQLAASGAYGKNPTFAKVSDFAPWLDSPIDLDTAMKEWH